MKAIKKRAGRSVQEDGIGTLPGSGPLAVAYIPAQQANPPQYEPPKAMIRGTLFPGLDLPFSDQENRKLKPQMPTARMQEAAFAVQELALYLDTHREDTEALAVYRACQDQLQAMIREYEAAVGPWSHQSRESGPYRWTEDPWPWEYGANFICGEGQEDV